MPAGDGHDPISDEEIVYRRVPEHYDYYDPNSEHPVAWIAFRPNQKDTGGLSVWRGKYLSAPEAAAKRAHSGKRYYVIALSVGRLREIGISVEPTSEDGGVGHASLTNMNYHSYQESKNAIRNWAEKITAELVEQVHGPFVAT